MSKMSKFTTELIFNNCSKWKLQKPVSGWLFFPGRLPQPLTIARRLGSSPLWSTFDRRSPAQYSGKSQKICLGFFSSSNGGGTTIYVSVEITALYPRTPLLLHNKKQRHISFSSQASLETEGCRAIRPEFAFARCGEEHDKEMKCVFTEFCPFLSLTII